MNSENTKLLVVLKEHLLQFFEELVQLLPNEKELLVIHFFIKEQVPITDVMKYIKQTLVPMEPYVQKRDGDYFVKHPVLFERLQTHDTKVNHFKEIWYQQDDEDNKEAIWLWLTFFIDLAKKYKET